MQYTIQVRFTDPPTNINVKRTSKSKCGNKITIGSDIIHVTNNHHIIFTCVSGLIFPFIDEGLSI